MSSLERNPQVVPPVFVSHPLITGAAGQHEDPPSDRKWCVRPGVPGVGRRLLQAEATVGTRPPRAAESASATHRAPLGRAARVPLGGPGSAGRVAVLALAERSVLQLLRFPGLPRLCSLGSVGGESWGILGLGLVCGEGGEPRGVVILGSVHVIWKIGDHYVSTISQFT